MEKKTKKVFLVSGIISYELAALNSFYYEGNTCHGQSLRKQTLFRLCISVREIFSNPIAFTVINNYTESGVLQISRVLLPVDRAARRSVV